MKKAALIIDMPECCGDCSLMVDDCAGGYCIAYDDEQLDTLNTMEGKPNWCPLREITEN